MAEKVRNLLRETKKIFRVCGNGASKQGDTAITTKERKLPWTMDELRAKFKQDNQDLQYFLSRAEELLEKYPEQWVAIYRRELVAHARSLDKLFREIDRRGIPRNETRVEFLTEKPRPTIPG